MTTTAQCETGRIQRLLLCPVESAFRSQARVDAQWRALNYLDRPDYRKAMAEYEAFAGLLEAEGMIIHHLSPDGDVGMDAIYVRDASIACDAGPILCNMGKAARAGEPAASAAAYVRCGLNPAGAIAAPGRIEGGDVLWLDRRTLVVGRGYRTNADGIAQLKALLPAEVSLVEVPLPHWQGEQDVFHLMSMLSPIDQDLMLAFSPLLPVPFREWLLERGISLVEVPEEEFHSMGCNVLALAPRRCLMLDGNPVTRARLEAAGAEVMVYRGDEISRKGCGGPTCLTRPLLRQIA